MAISKALGLGNQVYDRRPDAASRTIKGYVQLLKILVYAGAAILIIAVLMDQSPLLLLSGLGAMAAVLMLVFKDTILSLVASVQRSEEHTSELQSLMRSSYAVFCLIQKKTKHDKNIKIR